MGSMDYYEGQAWKRDPGVGDLVSWVVRHIQVSFSVESLGFIA